MPFFLQLSQLYFQLVFQQALCSARLKVSQQFFYANGTVALSSTITQALGEMHTSQSVNAYNASIVISGEIPGARSTQYLYICSRIIRYFFDLDLTLVVCLYN